MKGYNVNKENAEFKYPTLYKYSCQMLLLNMINIWTTHSMQGGRGHWAVYYTSPKKIYNNCLMISCFIKLSVRTFQPLILIQRRGNFVYNNWGCTSMYQPISYPFRSMPRIPYFRLSTYMSGKWVISVKPRLQN